MKRSRAASGHAVVHERLKRSEMYGLQSNNDVKLIKWKDKRDGLMISTKPSHSATLVDTEKTSRADQRIMKPSVVLDYNKGKKV